MLKYKETKIKIFILNLTIRTFWRHKLFLAFSVVLLFIVSFFLQGGQLTANVLESVLLTTEIRQLGLVRPELLAGAPDTGKLRPVDSALVSENSARTALIPLSIMGPFALRNSDSEELRYFHQNISSAGGSYSTNKVLHEEVWKFVDMFVIANQDGLEENFILKNNQFPTEFNLVVETVDLELHVDADGQLQFFDESGELEFTAAAPTLTDVTGRQLSAELQNEIVWEVAEIEVIEEADIDSFVAADDDIEYSQPVFFSDEASIDSTVASGSVGQDTVEFEIEVIKETDIVSFVEDEINNSENTAEFETESVGDTDAEVELTLEFDEIELSEDEDVEDTTIEEVVVGLEFDTEDSQETELIENTEIEEIDLLESTDEDFSKAVQKQAKQIAKYSASAEQNIDKGKFDKARDFVQKVLSLDSDNAEAVALLEKINQAEVTAQVEVFAKAIAKQLAAAEKQLAKAKFDKARDFIQKVFNLESDNVGASTLLEKINQAEIEEEAQQQSKKNKTEDKDTKEEDDKNKKQAFSSLFQASRLMADILKKQTKQEIFAESEICFGEGYG